MKFSIIVPVYNVEQFLRRCLDSLLNQSYTNFEILVVNDGTPDNSQAIIDEYVAKDKRFKSYIKENGGLSDARNYGVKQMSVDSDYIFFLDSDDYINQDLLLTLNSSLCANKVDALKYRAVFVDEDGGFLNDAPSIYFNNVKGIDALKLLLEDDIFMTAWSYVYRREFWLENGFEYPIGRVHEDFAITPIVLLNATSVTSLDFVGVNYVQRANSIMSQVADDKLIKKSNDHIANVSNLLKVFTASKEDSAKIEFFTDYFARAMIHYALKLPNHLRESFLENIKDLNLYQYVRKGRLRGRIEYWLIKNNLNKYIEYIEKSH